jgi:hypothetical protein
MAMEFDCPFQFQATHELLFHESRFVKLDLLSKCIVTLMINFEDEVN